MFIIFVLSILANSNDEVIGQKWITPTNRIAFGETGKPISLNWEMDSNGKQISLATWQLYDEQDNLQQTIVYLNKDGKIQTYTGVISTEFGKITINNFDPGLHKKLKITVEFVGADQIFDELTFRAVGKTPVFTSQDIQQKYDFKEDDPSNKDIELTVVTKGNPNPTVVWTLNGKNVTTLDGFVVVETLKESGEDVEVTSILKIAKLTGEHNGELKVVTKYGNPGESSPQTEVVSMIDIKFGPKNIVFNHNITTNVIVYEGYINLTCKAEANPKPTYVIKDGAEVIATKNDVMEKVIFLNQYHHKRKLHYICYANNSLGTVHQSAEEIIITNGTLTGKRTGEEDMSMWVYFGVACGVALIIFIGVFITLFVIRSRMRTLNLKNDINRVKMRDSQKNGPNHVYDLNERGRRGTATDYDAGRARQTPQINVTQPEQNFIPTAPNHGVLNPGYENELYDELQEPNLQR